MKADLQTIVKANNILLDKLAELKDYYNEMPLINSKEEERYSKINKSENAKEYKNKYLLATKEFKDRIILESNNVNNTNYNKFVKKLVNNYAKVEDEYYMLLNISKTSEMTASLMFKCECKLDYLLENLSIINENVNSIELDENQEMWQR